jgi:hypothetical protein
MGREIPLLRRRLLVLRRKLTGYMFSGTRDCTLTQKPPHFFVGAAM